MAARITVNVVLSKALKARLIRQAAKETLERGRQVTISDIIRWALEDYLDYFEPATFSPVDEDHRSFLDMKHEEREV